ncbi:lactoylglutathione lyase [Spirochaetia bacterium]|nr:lactoylglutathione lyase [Spirochaetia bacterium]
MGGVIDAQTLTQVGFIVKDVEKTKAVWAEFLGVTVPPTQDVGKYEVTQTRVDGKPAPKANCLMAFFDVGPNVQIELIQPNEEKSTWRDFLDEHGEGIHHIAFHLKEMDDKIISCEKFGMKCVQRGTYGDGSGEYAYMAADDKLKCLVELLENYK